MLYIHIMIENFGHEELSPIEKVLNEINDLQWLNEDERAVFLTENFGENRPWYIDEKFLTVIKSGDEVYFGVSGNNATALSEAESIEVHPLKILIHSCRNAVEMYKKMLDLLPEEIKNKAEIGNIYKIELTNDIKNFGVPFHGNADYVQIADEKIDSIKLAIADKDEARIHSLILDYGSQFIHELVHIGTNEDHLNTDCAEEISLLAELMFNPSESNPRAQLIAQLMQQVATKERVGQDNYTQAAGKLIDILKNELPAIVNNKPEELADDLLLALKAIDEKQRLSIAAKYISKNTEQL